MGWVSLYLCSDLIDRVRARQIADFMGVANSNLEHWLHRLKLLFVRGVGEACGIVPLRFRLFVF